MSRGGVSDNSSLKQVVGNADISNVGNSLTEIVGNETLKTTAQTLSGAVNEAVTDIYVGNDGKLHKIQGGADSVIPFSGNNVITYLTIEYTRNTFIYSVYKQNINKDKTIELLHTVTIDNNKAMYSKFPFSVGDYTIKKYTAWWSDNATKMTSQFIIEFMGDDFTVSKTTTGNVGFSLYALKFIYNAEYYIRL